MDFLGFTLSVWTAIALGVFVLAMIIACTSDRNGRAGPKWGVLFVGAIVFGFMFWGELSWRVLLTTAFWKNAGIYAGIGLAYSLAEFLMTIRREERYWAESWARFKNSYQPSGHVHGHGHGSGVETPAKAFVRQSGEHHYRASGRMVGVELSAQGSVVPVVNRVALAQNIGAWTTFWPAYAVSLVVGDLFAEICRKVADVLASLSGRLVRKTFSKTFTP